MQRMQALEEDDEDPRSYPRERRAYGQRVARDHRTRGQEQVASVLVMQKRKEMDEAGEQ